MVAVQSIPVQDPNHLEFVGGGGPFNPDDPINIASKKAYDANIMCCSRRAMRARVPIPTTRTRKRRG